MSLARCIFSVFACATRLHAMQLEVKPEAIAVNTEGSQATPSAVDVTIKIYPVYKNLTLLRNVVLNLGDGSTPRNCTMMEFSAICHGISLSRTGSFPAQLFADSNAMGYILLYGFESPPAMHLQPDHYSLSGGDAFTLELLNISQLPVGSKPQVHFSTVDPQCNGTFTVSAKVVPRGGRVYLHGLCSVLIQQSFGLCAKLEEMQVLVSYSLNTGSQVVNAPRPDNQQILAKKVRPFKIVFFFSGQLDSKNGLLSLQNRARLDLIYKFGGRIETKVQDNVVNTKYPLCAVDICGDHCTGPDGWCQAMEGCPMTCNQHFAYYMGEELFRGDKADMIVGTSYDHWMDMKQLAIEFPSKWVLLTYSGSIPGQYISHNFAHVDIKNYQATYMMGYTLGQYNGVRANPRVGFVGSTDSLSTKELTSAFVKGVWEGLGGPAEMFIILADTWRSQRRASIAARRLFEFFNVSAIFSLLDGDGVNVVAKAAKGVSVGNNLDLMPTLGESVLASKVLDLGHMVAKYVEAAISGIPWGSPPPADHPAATILPLHCEVGRDQLGWRMLTYSPVLGHNARLKIEAREKQFAEGNDDVFCNTLQQEGTGAEPKQLWGGALNSCIGRAHANWGIFWNAMNIRDACISGYGQFDGKCYLGLLNTTNDVPDECPDGFVLKVRGCQACPSGHFRPPQSDEGDKACKKCRAGYYAPNPGWKECLAAPLGTFVSDDGSSTYTECPKGTFAASAASSACSRCVGDTYANKTGQAKCEICPAGGDCSYGSDVVAQEGYWKTHDGRLLQCTIPGACKGGTQICAEGMHGPLCSGCDVGWTHQTGTVCEPCPDFGVNAFLIFLTLAAYAVYIGIMVVVVGATRRGKRGFRSVVLKLFTTYLQSQSIGLSVAISDQMTGLTGLAGVASSPDKAIMKFDCLLRDPSFTFGGDGGHGTHAESWILIAALTLIPAAMIVSMMVVFLGRSLKRLQFPESMGAWLRTMVPQFIIICFVLHPTVTNSLVSNGWQFQRIDGKFYLESNPDVEWTSEIAKLNRLLSGIGLIVFVLGIPTTFLIMLWKQSDKLGFGKTRRMLGFLYNGYEQRCYYWEVVVMLRKALLVAAANSIGWTGLAKAMRLLSIGLMSLALHLLIQPFDDREFAVLDKIESWSLCAFITLPLLRMIEELEYSPHGRDVGVPIIWCFVILFQVKVLHLVIWSLLSRHVVNYVEQRARNQKSMPWYLSIFLEGRLRIHIDGSLDCSELSAIERNHLMLILKNALGCTMGANAVFSTEVFRQVLQCTAGRVMCATLERLEREQREKEEADAISRGDGEGLAAPVGVLGRFLVAFAKHRIRRSLRDLDGSEELPGAPSMSLCQASEDRLTIRHKKLEEVAKTSEDFCTQHAVNGTLPPVTVHEFYDRLADVIEDIEAGCLLIPRVKMRVPKSIQNSRRPRRITKCHAHVDGWDDGQEAFCKGPENDEIPDFLGFTARRVFRDAGVQVHLAVEDSGVAAFSQSSTSETVEAAETKPAIVGELQAKPTTTGEIEVTFSANPARAGEIEARPARAREIEAGLTNAEVMKAVPAKAGEAEATPSKKLPQRGRDGAEPSSQTLERLPNNVGERAAKQQETTLPPQRYALNAEGPAEEAINHEQSFIMAPLCDPPRVWVDLGDYDEQEQEHLYLSSNVASQAA